MPAMLARELISRRSHLRRRHGAIARVAHAAAPSDRLIVVGERAAFAGAAPQVVGPVASRGARDLLAHLNACFRFPPDRFSIGVYADPERGEYGYRITRTGDGTDPGTTIWIAEAVRTFDGALMAFRLSGAFDATTPRLLGAGSAITAWDAWTSLLGGPGVAAHAIELLLTPDSGPGLTPR